MAKNGDLMKKLLLIFLAGIALAAPAQGMEKLKAWFGFTKNSSHQEITNDQTCPICLDNLITNPPAAITKLPCHSQHVFHTDCITMWKAHQLSTHGEATCPFCQKSYSKTLKADLMPSVYYTASMLFATFHHSLASDWALDSSKNNQAALAFIYISDVLAANVITDACLRYRHHNKQLPAFNKYNLIISATTLLAGLKYKDYILPIFNDKNATYTTRALALCPLIIGYFAAGRLLKFETNQ